MPPIIDVVAAVIYRPDGSYLLAQRPPGKVYAGYWEFPGGKVEPGETSVAAIRREIGEELGIEVLEAQPWLMREHVYEHAAVRLRFFRVTRWRGEPRGLEGQRFEFQYPGHEVVNPMLPANGPILKAMRLPQVLAITNASEIGIEAFHARLETALENGLRLVQVRERGLSESVLREFSVRVLERCRAYGAQMLINDDVQLAAAIGADGIHLPARRLFELDNRPDFELVGASVHDTAELARAQSLGCDFALLGPVLATPTHPDSPTLSWNGFTATAADAALPVYALGGIRMTDLDTAMRCGAQGIAMIRGAWTTAPQTRLSQPWGGSDSVPGSSFAGTL